MQRTPKISQKPDGSFYLDETDGHAGKRRRLSLGTDPGAALSRAVALVLGRNGMALQTDLDFVPLRWCVERYQSGDWFAVLSVGGKRASVETARAVVLALGPDLDVNRADWPVVWSRALAGWRAAEIAATTVNKRRAVLIRVLRFCHDPEKNGGQRGRVIAVPFLSGYQRAKGEPRTRWLRRAEFQALASELGPARARWLALACWTGQRNADVSSMTWRHVDGSRWARRSQKTHAAVAWLPIPTELAAYLGPPGPPDERIVGRWGNSRRDLHAAAIRLGIPPVSAHDCRRTCATWLLEAGAGRETARHWLGLAEDSRLLESVYGRRGPRQAARDAADIRRALSSYAKPLLGSVG